jgi:hypothetical protein
VKANGVKLSPRHLVEVNGQLHAPVVLLLVEEFLIMMDKRLGGSQICSECSDEEKNPYTPTRI